MSKEQWEVYIENDDRCIGVLSTQHYRYDDVLLRISGNFKLDAEKIDCARQIAFDLNEIERLRSEVAELKAERDRRHVQKLSAQASD